MGAISVGKTAIVNRYIYNTFNPLHHLTIGASYYSSKIKLDTGKEINVNLWDCAAADGRFNNLMPIFFKNACVALVVYDVTHVDSFDQSLKLIEFLRQQLDDVDIVLVGNKIDLDKTITTNVETIANQCGVSFFECSAKTGRGVAELFDFVHQQIKQRHHQKPHVDHDHVVLQQDDRTLSCCHL